MIKRLVKITRLYVDLRLFSLAAVTIILLLVFNGAPKEGKWEVIHSVGWTDAPNMEPIRFDDPADGWVLTTFGLSRVQDQGKTWSSVLSTEGKLRGFYSVFFTSPTNVTVVGTQRKGDEKNVLILQTLDGGKSWEERDTDVQPTSNRDDWLALNSVVFCGAQTGWSVGGNLILRTTDGGRSWSTQHVGLNDKSLNTVACLDSEHAWAAGTGGVLLKTSDGNTWTRQESHTDGNLIRLRFFNQNGWIVGGGETGEPVLLRSTDEGENWQPQELDVTERLFDVFFIDGHGWIAGEDGLLMASDDGGQSWVRRPAPTKENLTSLFFLTPELGWAGGDRSTLLRFTK